ncbi:MAG: threonine synthase [Patescibacteria group bacterium]|nr:MAG: threonine synthase [Patescibacteria group bacterium]
MTIKSLKMTQTWLQCIDCGHKTDLLEERLFRCPNCDGLYDVCHDYPKVQKSTFDARTMARVGSSPMNRSGVWRFKELIMPYLPESDIISLGEGNVPIVEAGRNLKKWIGGELDLWLILEGMTPTGSFKDFGGTVMMSVAKAAGINTVACASTGDTSAMAAAYAAAGGMKCAVILPEGKVTAAQLVQPLVYGASVITLPGDFDDCMRVMQELVRNYGVYPANSLNPTRIEGHQATTFLLAQFFNWTLPDWIAVPVGNGSNSSSIGKGMRLLKDLGLVERTARILGCQSEAANPLSKSWMSVQSDGHASPADWRFAFVPIAVGETTATAARIGNPVSKDKVIREVTAVGYAEGAMEIADEEALNEAVEICGKDGIFICPQTGTALAGVRNALRNGRIESGQRIVVVSTATGLKFTESVTARLETAIIKASDCETSTIAKKLGV